MTTNNPNVFYELGYAHALSKPVILITRDRVSVPFDLRGVNNLEYKHASDLVDALPAFIKAVLQL
jgi:nucleoside 2-deoxyribosyltransferase